MMINLDLNETDEEILEVARKQGKVYRKYTKSLDHTMRFGPDYKKQYAIPGEEDFIHVRNLIKEKEGQTSGAPILEALLYLEEAYAGKPFYYRGPDADAFDVRLSTKLLKVIGTPEQQARWSDTFLAWGMSEPGAGSDPASMKTKAVLDPATKEWVINGEKTFISFGECSDGVLALCRCVGPDGDEGISPIIVEQGTPGFEVGPQMKKLGLRQWDTVALSFMDCRVPYENRLSGSLKDALSGFNPTRALIAAQGVGYIRLALDYVRECLKASGIEVDYASDLASRPAVVDRLMRLEAMYEATYLTTLHAKWHEQEFGPQKFYPALAKLKGGLMGRKIISECMSILGGASLSEDHPLEQTFRDARILDIYEGPGEAQRLILGRALFGYNAKELN